MSKASSPQQFVVAYMEAGGDLDSTSIKLGVKVSAVKQRLIKLRRAGVKLPVKKQSKGYDVQSLNSLIKQYKESK